ncbi:PREDICTED: pumilio domain-containing protein KIAA0020 [Wasmannia auropunctata]|uniref:pumilio domain-containing protein KIAA0020 n=1 Tax=Wasmannia auropunctata TaxID=64793 RepID=UPI0005EE078D|nr:PREDICTED: pumilio domain-containing protein KIAA0020 [Wasmannia auropunctata]XP_011685009.1 PREDICTED: pumilio domain-containing protein KIAA0020 [Wasmannia auropunctata]
MKRSARSLDADDPKEVSADTAEDDKNRKKVRFEKSLDNKSTGKNIKPSLTKNSKGTSVTAARNKSTIDKLKKISALKLKREKKELGQRVEDRKNSRDDDPKSGENKAAATEKTDWLRLKREKKELKQKRKARRLNDDAMYDRIIQAKRISEKLRRSDCKAVDRVALTQTLHDMLKGNYVKVVYTHDMSRVVQCMIKYSKEHIRAAIFREMQSSVVEMLRSKYAKNCVKAIMKYSSQETRRHAVSELYGNVVELMRHSVSAPLVEHVYRTWCTNLEKMHLKQEFYGSMYGYGKVNDKIESLSDLFKTEPDMKLATLKTVKGNLNLILNKGHVNSTLVQTVLWEFLGVCPAEDRSELIVALRSHILTLSQTKMGARVAMQCVWHGNSKDRKIIMKAIKGNVRAMCMSKHGYMTLLALLDSVDDTVLMQKIILSELQEDLVNVALNEYGKHVILYLVARRNPLYFSPGIVELLRQGDNNSASKKLADMREMELLDAIRDPLFDAIIADAATWLSNGGIAMITLAILKVGSGEKLKSAFESIAKFICGIDSKIKDNNVEYSAVEHSGLHLMLKKLIQHDKELGQKKESTFGEMLMSHLSSNVLEKWTELNRACFLLIFLLENEENGIKNALLSQLKPLIAKLETMRIPGASILLKKSKE